MLVAATVLLAVYAYLVYRSGYTITRDDGTKYLTRWYFLLGDRTGIRKHLPFNLFLHKFWSSDARTFHSHPWRWSRSLILKGGYVEYRREITLAGFVVSRSRTFSPGKVNRIDAEDFHYVILRDDKPCWSLFVAGPSHGRGWGFLGPEGFVPADVALEGRDTLSHD